MKQRLKKGVISLERNNRIDILDILGNYGQYVCHIGEAMDKVGISISKMRKLTGLNHEIVKKYYEDRVVRIDKDVFARISYVLMLYGIDPKDLLEYIPPQKKMNQQNNPLN